MAIIPFIYLPIGEKCEGVVQNTLRKVEVRSPPLKDLVLTILLAEKKISEEIKRHLINVSRKTRDTSDELVGIEIRILGEVSGENGIEEILEMACQVQNGIVEAFNEISQTETDVKIPPLGVEAVGFLKEKTNLSLLAKKLKERETPVHQLWLISPWNGKIYLSDEELYEMTSYFLFLQHITDFSNQERGARKEVKIGSFGLSGVVFPKKETITKKAAEFALEVLEKVVLPEASEVKAFSQEIEDFFNIYQISISNIKDRIKEDTRLLTYKEKSKLKLDPKTERPEKWPDILWSTYYFFLLSGILNYPLRKIKENKDRIRTKISEGLKRKLDELIEKHSNPRTVLPFLKGISEKAHKFLAERVPKKESKFTVKEAINTLQSVYAFLPYSFWSVILRSVVFSFILAYPLHIFLPQIISIPFLVRFFTFPILFIFFLILFFLLLTLHFIKRKNKFEEARIKAESALWDSIEAMFDTKAHNGAIDIIQELRNWTAPPEDLAKTFRNIELFINEYSKVLEYIGRLKEAHNILKSIPEPSVPSPFLSFVEWYTLNMSYKEGNYEFPEEISKFLRDGLHKNWRELDAEGIAQNLINLVEPGFDHLRVLKVESLLATLEEEKIRNLKNKLLTITSPFLALSPSISRNAQERRILFLANESDRGIMEELGIRNAEICQTNDYSSLFLLNVISDIKPEDLIEESAGG